MASAADQLLKMPAARLNELFSNSHVGEVPVGRGRGTVLFATGTVLARPIAWLSYLLIWRGKVLNPETKDLRNILSPLAIPGIRALVYQDRSWLDDKDCIVLDYSKTSFVARWIRDEIREVIPNTYLGLVFLAGRLVLRFVLTFSPPPKSSPPKSSRA